MTPSEPERRGAQLSLKFRDNPKKLMEIFAKNDIMVDFREPDIIRAAPAPLYCRYQDVYKFVKFLSAYAQKV